MAATTSKVAETATGFFHRNGGKAEDEKNHMTFPIPIREDYVVEMKLPRNLKLREAEKLSRVLIALATEEPDNVTSLSSRMT